MSVPALPGPIPNDLVAPPVPVSYPRLLLSIVQRRGIQPAALLSAAGIAPQALERPDGQVFASEYAALVAQALTLSADPCLGCEMGLNMPPTMHGFLGYALLSAGTLGEALDLGVKYAPLASRFVDVRAEHSAAGVVLTFEALLPLGFAHQFGVESTMTGWLHTAEQLVGMTGLGIEAETSAELRFTWPRPAAFARYAQRLPKAIFKQAANQIVIDAATLHRPLALAHPLAARQAQARCDSELAELLASDGYFAARVAESLSLSVAGYPGMEEIAARLRMSSRTLMRKLDKLGVSFRLLMDERRRLDAQALLADPTLAIDTIAVRLGYANPANFTRAFRRWTGMTPSGFRLANRDQTSSP